MAESYQIVYSLAYPVSSAGLPALVAAGNLLNSATGSQMLQLKLQSLSDKPIVSLEIAARIFNKQGSCLEELRYSYQNLYILRDQEFGQTEPIFLDVVNAAGFQACVCRIVFADGDCLEVQGNPFENGKVVFIPEKRDIAAFFDNDPELAKQFKLQEGENNVFEPVIMPELWRCTCGALNHALEQSCHSCGCSREKLLSIDKTKLRREKNSRISKEKRRRDDRSRAIKRILIVAISLILVVSVTLVVYNKLLLPSGSYKKALAAEKDGDYKTAYELFSISNNEDSKEKAKEAAEKYALTAYNDLLCGEGDDFLEILENEEGLSGEEIAGCEFAIGKVQKDGIPGLVIKLDETYIFVNIISSNNSLEFSVCNDFEGQDIWEVGYFENEEYLILADDYGDGGESITWLPYVMDGEGRVFQRGKYKGEVDYVIIDEDGDPFGTPVSESDFYEEVYKHVSEDTYIIYDFHRNNEKNRKKYLSE